MDRISVTNVTPLLYPSRSTSDVASGMHTRDLDISDEMDVEAGRPRYEADRAKDIQIAGAQGIDAAVKANNLDALLRPGASGAAIAAKPVCYAKIRSACERTELA